MNIDETIELWNKCQSSKRAALAAGQDSIAAQSEAAAIWNAWADEMLTRRTRLEEAGEWVVEMALFGDVGKNEVTMAWLNEAQVLFESVRFVSKTLDNPGAMISDNADSARFRSIRYDGNSADFRDFKFPDAVSFRETQFLDGSWFSGAIFFGPAFFSGTVFVGPVSFEGASFGLVHFGDLKDDSQEHERVIQTEFRDDCDFAEARFDGGVWFSKAIFSGRASFHAAEFAGFVWFDDANFSGVAWFTRTIFSVSSAGTLFGHGVSFDRATFAGDATFKGTNFTDTVSFKTTAFLNGVSFEEAKLNGGALLDGAVFSAPNS